MLSDNLQEAEAEEVRVKAEFENKTEVARSQRDYQLNKSSYDIEVNTKVSAKFILVRYVTRVHDEVIPLFNTDSEARCTTSSNILYFLILL